MDNRIQEAPLSMDALIAASARADCGALAVFAGTVRNHHENKPVLSLSYTAHVPLAEKMIREIEQRICSEHGVPYCRVVHRLGSLQVGDSAIVAVVRAPHRAEAFAALRAAVDATKHTVPIWKEEFYLDGTSAFVTGCCIGDALPLDGTPAEPAQRHAHGHDHHDHSHH
ncbi:MAG TPA: molybdenum cofactor biosynthesis protein MoaE [Fontimonas sp.]